LGSYLPQLLITDLMMPQMDGLTLIRFMKKEKRYSKIKTIVLTSIDNDDQRMTEFKELGVDKILSKPLEINIFNLALDSLLTPLDDVYSTKEQPSKINDEMEVNEDLPILNPDRIRKFANGDIDIINELIDIFIEENPADIQKMEMALSAEDLDLVSVIAHGIKGVADNVGGTRLNRLASEIEAAALQNKKDFCRKKVPWVQKEFNFLIQALKEENW
jgi:HPt (histidine-containing phosphotransfer) domain-containing protein